MVDLAPNGSVEELELGKCSYWLRERRWGVGTLGGGERRAADGAGRPVPVSTAAFFLGACADGAGHG